MVEHRDDPSLFLVRARVEDDLLALRDLAPGIDPWYDRDADYPWRAELPRDEWCTVAAALSSEIDYGNFKDEIAELQGRRRAYVYSGVWETLRELETDPR